MMNERRAQRVAEALKEELAELIAYELNDPRVDSVSVTEVFLSPDMKKARVLVAAGEETLNVLEGARHYLRREVAARLNLFRAPDLHFEADAGVAPDRIPSLLKRMRKGRPQDEKNPS